jgi:hypothetical protein
MGKRGPAPKPAERKRATGNPGKRPLPAKSSLRAVAPVQSSDVLALTVEQALERSLTAGAAWIAESDTAQVVVAREAAEFYAELRSNPQSKPADVLAALKAMESAFGRLGFNPGERSALGLAEVKAASKMEALRARHEPVVANGSSG